MLGCPEVSIRVVKSAIFVLECRLLHDLFRESSLVSPLRTLRSPRLENSVLMEVDRLDIVLMVILVGKLRVSRVINLESSDHMISMVLRSNNLLLVLSAFNLIVRVGVGSHVTRLFLQVH